MYTKDIGTRLPVVVFKIILLGGVKKEQSNGMHKHVKFKKTKLKDASLTKLNIFNLAHKDTDT